MAQFKLEREVMDPKKEARMAKILEIYKEESLDRCDPVVNPDGKSAGNVGEFFSFLAHIQRLTPIFSGSAHLQCPQLNKKPAD